MKITKRLLLFLGMALVLLVLGGCAPTGTNDGLIFGQSYRLGPGETIDHDLAVFGGSVILDKNSVVNGSVAIFGGSLMVDGEVNGDVAAFGGVVSLADNAKVSGNVLTYGASVSRSDSAVVKGSIGSGRTPVRIPNFVGPTISGGVKMVADFFWRIFQSFALAALAVLVSLFALRPMERAGDAMIAQPPLSALMGFLTALVGSVLLALLAVTIILSPISLLGFLLLGVGALFGWMVLGLVTGERMARVLNQSWSGPVSAGVGTLVLSLAANLIGIIPCIGWTVVAVAFCIGLGGVVLTRFGMQPYPPQPVQPRGPENLPPSSGGVEVA
jgi:hypothetical protein